MFRTDVPLPSLGGPSPSETAGAAPDRLPSKPRDPRGTYRDAHDTLRSEANDGVIIDRTAAQWQDSSFRVPEELSFAHTAEGRSSR